MKLAATTALAIGGIDEKAIKKRHRYFTIVSELETGKVIWIDGRGRKRETIDVFGRLFPLRSEKLSKASVAIILVLGSYNWCRAHCGDQ